MIAMHYIASNKGRVVPAKEIAEHYDISFEFLSKALQILMRKKYITSQQGVSGGYMLLKDPHETSVAEVIEAVDGKPLLVECCGEGNDGKCGLDRKCPIKTPMAIIQRRIDEALYSMTIEQMVADSHGITVTRFSLSN